ncbi:MAG: mechanosensitive ion channel family protein [Bacteroidales bacterium]|nr:mechanosensitive ion channel family protein [Bacteroidales bacterium]
MKMRTICLHKLILCLCLLIATISGGHGQAFHPDSLLERIDTAAVMNRSDQITSQNESSQSKETIGDELKPPSVSELISVPKVLWSLIFLLIGFFVTRLIIGFLNTIAVRRPKSRFAIKRAIPLVRIFIWSFIVYLIIVGIFSPPAATLFAFLASIGVAVGFASQDLLKNIFGGLVVMFDKPYQIGDKIEAGKYYGTVVGIGIRSTRIVTPDDSLVTIPNSEFMNQYVSNANSGENNCQVVAELYLPIDIDMERVRTIATEAAHVSKYIYLNKPVVVLFINEVQGRKVVLKMRIKAYVSDLAMEFVFKSEMTEIVIRELLKQGVLKPGFYDNTHSD